MLYIISLMYMHVSTAVCCSRLVVSTLGASGSMSASASASAMCKSRRGRTMLYSLYGLV